MATHENSYAALACVDVGLSQAREQSSKVLTEHLDNLDSLYLHGTEEVRFKIINALPTLGFEFALLLAVRALQHDESALVRHEAAFVIGAIGTEQFQNVLCNIGLRDESFLVRHEAAMALASIGNAASVVPLEEGLADKSQEVAVSCRVALSSIRYRLTQNLA